MEPKRLVLPTIPRREEEATIVQALTEAQKQGSAVRAVFVEGCGGTGKTTLVASAFERARLRRSNKNDGRCYCHAATKLTSTESTCAMAPLTHLRQLVADLLRDSLNQQCTLTCKDLYRLLDHRQYEAVQTFTEMKSLATTRARRKMSFLRNRRTNSTRSLFGEDDIGELIEKESAMNGHSPLKDLWEVMDSSSLMNLSYKEEDEEEEKEEDDSFSNDEAVNKDSMAILTTAIKACIRAIASTSTVVLTIDDIQWACTNTREVLTAILTDPSLSSVVLCATYRAQDESACSGFGEWKEELQTKLTPSNMQTLSLDNLSVSQLAELLADAMNKERSDVLELTEILFGLTDGNLYHLKHILEELQDVALLIFDLNSFQWTWDTAKIKRHCSLSENVAQTVAKRMLKLDKPTQNALMLASCFGATFDVRALDACKSALNVECVYETISFHKQEFVIQLGPTQYKFAHDIVQSTAYGLLPEDMDLRALHWKIGSLLLENEELLQEDIILFAAVNHLNAAQMELQDCKSCEMRCKLAEINFRAGRRAASLSAFHPACHFLSTGIKSLGARPFETSHKLALKLFKLYATTEYVRGDVDASIKACNAILENTTTCSEKLSTMTTLIDCYLAKNDTPGLVDFCLSSLEHLTGERLPRNPNKLQVQMEYQKVKHRVKGMTNEAILGLPLMADSIPEMKLQLLSRLVLPFFQQEEAMLGSFIACRMLNITLDHGYAFHLTPLALVLGGAVIIIQYHDIQEGYRLGKIADQFIQTHRAEQGDISQGLLANLTKWWLEPATKGMDLFIDGNRAAMKAGRVGVAFALNTGYITNYFYTGLPLGPLLQDVENFCNLYLEYNHVLFFLLGSPLWQCLLNLTGRSKNAASVMEGDIIERRKTMPNPHNSGLQTLQSYQMVASFYLGDLTTATEMADILVRVKPGVYKCSFWYCSRRFVIALIAIANVRSGHRRKYKAEADKQLKYFRSVVKEGAINLVHKLQLLEAEMMTVPSGSWSFMNRNKGLHAILARYDEAIVSARRAGFLQDAALANYLCFQFCEANNMDSYLLEKYLTRSFDLWMDWGAVAVAESLVDRHRDQLTSESALKSLGDDSRRGSSSAFGSSVRSRARFDASLSAQHKYLSQSLLNTSNGVLDGGVHD